MWRGMPLAEKLSRFLHHDDTFKVPCLGKEVEGLHRGELVACGEELFEIAHLGGGIAGDIDNLAGGEGEQLVEEFLVAAFARRINDHGRFRGGKGDVGKDAFSTGGEEGGIIDLVEFGIAACPVGRRFADFNTGNVLELVGEAEGKQTRAAVGVDKVMGSACGGLLGDVAGESRENKGIILEEVPSEEMEGDVSGLGGDGF